MLVFYSKIIEVQVWVLLRCLSSSMMSSGSSSDADSYSINTNTIASNRSCDIQLYSFVFTRLNLEKDLLQEQFLIRNITNSVNIL